MTVEDVNDNSPEIVSVSPMALTVPESSAPHDLTIIIVVRDADSGENGEVHMYGYCSTATAFLFLLMCRSSSSCPMMEVCSLWTETE